MGRYNDYRDQAEAALVLGYLNPWTLDARVADAALAVYDPSDITSLYQDSAGTTPVTADGDPVGLMIDKKHCGGRTVAAYMADNGLTDPTDVPGHYATQATSGKRPVYKAEDGLASISFDGVTPRCLTVAIDLSATDAVTVVLPQQKGWDTQAGALLEYGTTSSAGSGVSGTFGLFAPITANTGSYQARSGGTNPGVAITASAYKAPHIAVLTLLADISGDLVKLRVNGVESTGAGDQGSGNFGNYTLNIGARNNAASLGFVGDVYGLIIADSAVDDATVELFEEWGRQRAGIPTADLVAWGDSFMSAADGGSTYPARMAVTMGVSVQNNGIGGQTSVQITARQGAAPALLTVTGNSIPASGAVTVTALSTRLLSTPVTTSVTRSITGYLNGIHGTLECVESASGDASDTYTFTRTASGSATATAANTAFYPDVVYRQRRNLIGIGRNDVGNLSTVVANVAAIVATLGHDQYLVVGVTNGSTEPSGSAGYTNVINLNAALAEAYGRRFVDIRTPAIEGGLAAAGITPTAQDLIDISNDVPPESLRIEGDNLHPNDSWLTLIAAQCVAAFEAIA